MVIAVATYATGMEIRVQRTTYEILCRQRDIPIPNAMGRKAINQNFI